ncbi:MAG: tetratricopeptide repeat protein [Labilithrix sp.]|nr:tetratricopeptide repeat protein [Labilithrix sp.]
MARTSTFLGVIGLVSLLSVAACAGKGGAGAQSPERQSDAEYDLARDLFMKNNPRAALDHAMKSVSLNEDNDKAQYFIAVIHLSFCSTNRGMESIDCKLDEVEKYARAALKANPDFRDAKNMLGQVLIHQKRCKEAITVLEPLTRDPAYVHPYYAWGNLGLAQVCAGQLDEGIKSLKNSVTEPRFCVGHYRLGIAYEKKGDFAAAEASLTPALTADPECEKLQDAWEARCRVRLRLGRTAEGREDCQRCKEISEETNTGKSCAKILAPEARRAGL